MNPAPSRPYAPAAPVAGPRAICWSCRLGIDYGDAFCRHCGKRQNRTDGWYYSPIWIVILTLTVLGPLAIPLVLKSPRLDRNGKIMMMTFVLAYSLLVVYSLYAMTVLIVHEFSSISGQMDQMKF